MRYIQNLKKRKGKAVEFRGSSCQNRDFYRSWQSKGQSELQIKICSYCPYEEKFTIDQWIWNKVDMRNGWRKQSFAWSYFFFKKFERGWIKIIIPASYFMMFNFLIFSVRQMIEIQRAYYYVKASKAIAFLKFCAKYVIIAFKFSALFKDRFLLLYWSDYIFPFPHSLQVFLSSWCSRAFTMYSKMTHHRQKKQRRRNKVTRHSWLTVATFLIL